MLAWQVMPLLMLSHQKLPLMLILLVVGVEGQREALAAFCEMFEP